MRTLTLVVLIIIVLACPGTAKSPYHRALVMTHQQQQQRPTPVLKHDHHRALSIPRGGGFSIAGWTLPASQLAKFYVGFTGFNGAAMAIVPTIAASSYGSAFDDSKGSLLATLLLERQGDAVLGTSILLYLSTFKGGDLPIAQSVAWSAVPYVVSLLKFFANTGQLTLLGFDTRVTLVLLLSILLPTVNILGNGWNPAVTANILASVLLLIGGAGTFLPNQAAGIEGINVADTAWIKACWLLATLCVLQHAVLMWHALLVVNEPNNKAADPYSLIGLAALLNVAVSTYVTFMSNIPAAIEMPKIGFVVWIVIGLIVGLGISV